MRKTRGVGTCASRRSRGDGETWGWVNGSCTCRTLRIRKPVSYGSAVRIVCNGRLYHGNIMFMFKSVWYESDVLLGRI